ARIFLVHPPIEKALKLGVGHGPPPIAVAMPIRAHEHHFAQRTLADHFDGNLVEEAGAALKSDLQRLFWIFLRRSADYIPFILLEVHGLLDEDVLAGTQGIDHHLGMEIQRRHDHDRVEIFPLQHLAVVFIRLRIRPDGFNTLLQIGRIYVAGGYTPALRNGREEPEQGTSLSSRADHSIVDNIVGTRIYQNSGRSHSRERGSRSHGGGRFQEIAAGYVSLVLHYQNSYERCCWSQKHLSTRDGQIASALVVG